MTFIRLSVSPAEAALVIAVGMAIARGPTALLQAGIHSAEFGAGTARISAGFASSGRDIWARH